MRGGDRILDGIVTSRGLEEFGREFIERLKVKLPDNKRRVRGKLRGEIYYIKNTWIPFWYVATVEPEFRTASATSHYRVYPRHAKYIEIIDEVIGQFRIE